MSDEKDIQDVRADELRAAKGKPPLHSLTAERLEKVRRAMQLAIKECDEAGFISAIHDLGHTEDSAEYARMMKLWTGHFGASRRR
jgi:hypothetical protein